jgi:FkbM family methyltransferase
MRRVIKTIRKTLKSRDIIENWLWSRIIYFLIRHGVLKRDSMLIKLKWGGSISIPPRVYSLLINAYFNRLIHEVYKEDDSLVIDGIIKISRLDDSLVYIMPDGIKLLAEDPCLGEYGETEFVTIHQTWILGSNFIAPVLNDWLVIDIGAFIGDTALYYAKRGAFVVAVEPIPSHYNVLLKNLELNPELKNRILPINAAISDHDGFVDLAIEGIAHGGASQYQDFSRKVLVRSFTLRSLLKYIEEEQGVSIGGFSAKAIKFDCEGCEYDVIDNEIEVVSLFDFLLVECHGYLRGRTIFDIINKLSERGFQCEPMLHDPYSELSIKLLSTLRCSKRLMHVKLHEKEARIGIE